ncbi:MAG: FAD-dependent oxidoreductase [Oscillospiraceae bacterium]|nr:FAD-dependent oxidoreductase [Oscillospiraceae bacterium]
MRKMEADVVVIAAGLSGMATIVQAAENGLKVVALEKAFTTGGAANMGMGPLGIGTKYQRMQAYDLTPGEIFRQHMNFVHWNADARLVRDYYFKSADTIEWLESMGVEFFPPGATYPVPERMRAYASTFPTGHCVKPEGGGMPGPRCAATMIKRMTERASELGAEILLQTPAQKIIMENGKAVGAMAVDKNGEEVEVRAKAVVICTGGAGDNPEMIKEHMGYEWGKNLFSFRIPGIKGEGIKMAWEAGAGATPLSMELMYQCPDNMSVFTLDGAFRSPDLWVNLEGERFFEEATCINSTFTGNAIKRQPGSVGISILDSAMVKKYKKHGPAFVDHVHGFACFANFENDVDTAIANGYQYVYKADTLEELAEKMGVNKERFLQTVEEYNGYCESNCDTYFEKEARYLKPVVKGPFYALKFYIGAYGTLGGISVNHRMEVLDKEGKVIPGLYAAGTDTCTIFGDTYPFTLGGNTMGYCLNTGRIAADTITDALNS